MNFFSKRKLFIFLIGFIIFAALIGFSLNERDELTLPEQFMKDTIGWFQNIIHTPIRSVVNVFSNMEDIKNTYEENKILREKLSEYKSLIYDVQELKKENEELRNLLDKTDSLMDFRPIQATVTSRSPEQWVEQITINRGRQHGVKKNMAVMTAEGMVGIIHSTSQFSSTVQLLTGFDQFNRISAMISREDDDQDIFGLIEAYDEETESLHFKIIEESKQDVKKGDKVMSSGMGGIFPAGLQIGVVDEIVPDKYGLTKTALVKPSANMYKINNVVVIDRQLDGSDEQEEKDEDE